MTAHDHSSQGDRRPLPPGARMTSNRPAWLVPALAIGSVAVALVVAGVLPISLLVYGGVFGGMILMHAGGHGGHAGHGGGNAEPGGGHAGHGGGTGGDDTDVNQPSSGSEPGSPASGSRLDDRASINRNGSDTNDHGQHGSHGCH
jgi:hypothetical protein